VERPRTWRLTTPRSNQARATGQCCHFMRR
jgi:hypothetical protein